MIVSRQEKNISFKAKKPDVRLADDIMRKSKLNFPCLSSTYVYQNYSCTREDFKNSDRVTKIMNNLIKNIYVLLRGGTVPPTVRGAKILDRLQQYKIGNCYEKVIAATAEFSRNGYKTLPAFLGIKMGLFDKKLNKITNQKSCDLDHTLAVTFMNNNERRKKDKLIVIDPWLGFCAEEKEAMSKYIQVFYNKIGFLYYKYKDEIKELNKDNFKISYNLDFFVTKMTDEELEEIWNYFKK